MRHTAITRLIKSGIDLKTVQKISGHKTLLMLLRYLQTSAPEIDQAMQLLNRTGPGKLAPAYRQPPEPALPSIEKPIQVIVPFKKKG